MQENFYEWSGKPYDSRLLYEHLVGFPKLPRQENTTYKEKPFWCHPADLTYFEKFPTIMETWTDQQQEEYLEYTNGIRKYQELLTEEFCGDLSAQHCMISIDIVKALSWIHRIDKIRLTTKAQDILERPLRIWMYKEEELVPSSFLNYHVKVNCS